MFDSLGQTVPASKVTVFCGNALCYTGVEDAFIEENYSQRRLLRMLLYSPIPKPTESVWSIAKNQAKREASTYYLSLRAGNPSGVLSQWEWRIQFVECWDASATPNISDDHCELFRRNSVCLLSMEQIWKVIGSVRAENIQTVLFMAAKYWFTWRYFNFHHLYFERGYI